MGNEAGIKLDQGKPRAGLMINDFGLALKKISEVTTFGADKYTPSGWCHVENAKERYFDAGMRHLLENGSLPIDEESNLEQLPMVVWNLLAVIELQEREKRGLA